MKLTRVMGLSSVISLKLEPTNHGEFPDLSNLGVLPQDPDWELIHAHWEDYLRVVLAIQSGQISASWILARLNSYSRQNRLYLAFQELGRVVRTVYLLR